jgi:hypothetical protein
MGCAMIGMRLALILALFPAGLSACGGSTQPQMQSSMCDSETRKDVYVAGLSKEGTGMTVKLLQSDPAPPIRGTNDWTLEILDGSGQPVSGAMLTVTPVMPDHGHGTTAPTINEAGGGKYTVSKIYMYMAGLWQVTIDVKMPAAMAPSSVVYNICVN